MTQFANHEHLSHHHRNTLETLFVHPTSGHLNKDLTTEQITDLRRKFRHAGFVAETAVDGQPEA